MISSALAERFIEQVTRYTDYNVNIMGEDGIIIASRDSSRVGRYHEVAWRIIHGNENIVDTTDVHLPNVRPGINMVIEIDGHREGVVGVTGDPQEIRPVALMVKMAIETMLKYERQQEEIRLRENKKERFLHLLTQVEASDPEAIRTLAAELGYPEEKIRIPILVYLPAADSEAFLREVRGSATHHTRSDFSIAPDSSHVLIFKAMPDDRKELFSEYKYHIGEYLSPVLRSMKEKGRTARFFIGSFQDSYARYYYAYRHCKWLEKHITPTGSSLFFYDHVGEYLRSVIPMKELQHVFYIYASRFPEQDREMFLETIGVLAQHNYNFAKASKQLYIHKNTLVYRYQKIKELMNVDPLASAGDRVFLEALSLYLRRI